MANTLNSLYNLGEVTFWSLGFLFVAFLSGYWANSVVRKSNSNQIEFALIAGIGLATQALVVSITWVLGLASAVPMSSIVVALLSVLTGAILRATRGKFVGQFKAWPDFFSALNWRLLSLGTPFGQTVFSFGLSLFVFALHATEGLVSWTIGDTSDLPRYVSSAAIWKNPPLQSEGSESYVLAANQARADREKPFVTGLLVAFSAFGFHLDKFLTPMVMALFFLLTRFLLEAAANISGKRGILSTLFVAVVLVASPQMTLFQFSQIGHLVAATFIGLSLVCLSILAEPRGRSLGSSLVLGLSVAAAIGSNPTLVLGSAPGIIGILLLAGGLGQFSWPRLRALLPAVLVTILLILPFASLFLVSLRRQSSGTPGGVWDLLPPHAYLGVTPFPFDFDTRFSSIHWFSFAVLLVLAILLFREKSIWDRFRALAGFAIWALNLVLIGLRVGLDNYATFKFLALTVPLLFASLGAIWLVRTEQNTRALAPVLSFLLLVSSSISIASTSRTYFSPPGLSDLRLADTRLNELNVALPFRDQGLIAGTLLAPREVSVTEWGGYVRYSYSKFQDAPNDGPFVVPRSIGTSDAWAVVEDINEDYVVAEPLLEVRPGDSYRFYGDSSARRFLFGNWGPTEPGGVTPRGNKTWLVFEIERGRATNSSTNIILNFAGNSSADLLITTNHPSEIQVSKISSRSQSILVPDEANVGELGRLVVQIQAKSKEWSLEGFTVGQGAD